MRRSISSDDIPVSISIPLQGARAGRYGLGTDPTKMVENFQAFQRLGVDTVVVAPPYKLVSYGFYVDPSYGFPTTSGFATLMDCPSA